MPGGTRRQQKKPRDPKDQTDSDEQDGVHYANNMEEENDGGPTQAESLHEGIKSIRKHCRSLICGPS